MKKAYFINGGMGRCFCALPALQRAYENGEDFIIVCDRKEDEIGRASCRERV